MAARGTAPLNPLKVGLWLGLLLLIIAVLVLASPGRTGKSTVQALTVVKLRGGGAAQWLRETILIGPERLSYRRALGRLETAALSQPLLDARGGAGLLASGPAAAAGRLVIAANLSFAAPGAVDEHPLVSLVHETGKIPYVGVGFAGRDSLQAGLNQAGVAVVMLVTNTPSSADRAVAPPVTSMAAILSTARDVDDALGALHESPPSFDAQFILADPSSPGVVAECVGGEVRARSPVGGLALVPAPTTPTSSAQPPLPGAFTSAALSRHQRLTELTTAAYGYLAPESAAEILRDRFDTAGRRFDPGGDVLASETTAISVIIDPAGKTLWVAAGQMPASLGPFTAFSPGGTMPSRSLAGATPPSPTFVRGRQAFEADRRALDDLLHGRYARAAERLEEALTLAETAPKPKPGVNDPEAMGPPGMGRLYLRLGDAYRLASDRQRSKAVEAYTKALATQVSRDDRAYGQMVLATLFERDGQVKEAIGHYRAALAEKSGLWVVEEPARLGLARLGQ
ncbi:MAG TPA: hypothetical protein VGL40_00725 [Bacillota bacterium]|jgi:hypothetical protein